MEHVLGKSPNEKIFENGKIFQDQETNESQNITNHIEINPLTEKTCLSDIKKKFKVNHHGRFQQ